MAKEFRHKDCGGEFDAGEPCPECGEQCNCAWLGNFGAAPCTFCENETELNEAPPAEPETDLDRFRRVFQTRGIMF